MVSGGKSEEITLNGCLQNDIFPSEICNHQEAQINCLEEDVPLCCPQDDFTHSKEHSPYHKTIR